MKEWIRKVVIVILIFGLSFSILSKAIEIDEDVQVPENAVVITSANKNLAIGALSIIVICALIQIYTIIKYINNTINPETFKINLIKLILITIALVIISALCYYIYLATCVTRFQVT